MSQEMSRVVAAAALLKEARALFVRVSGGAAPEARPESSVAKSGGARLIEIAKERAERHRLTKLRIEEVSLVDAPASPGAVVVMQKARTGGSALVEMARAKARAAR